MKKIVNIMIQKPEIKLFDEKLVCTVWDNEQEKWISRYSQKSFLEEGK